LCDTRNLLKGLFMFRSRTKIAAIAAVTLVAFGLGGAQGATRLPIIGHGKRLVYAALSNSIAVFTTEYTSPSQIGSITSGIGAPAGIFADSHQLYVANNNPVSVTTYFNGDREPNTMLTVPNPSYGLGAITAGPDGTIYVATLNGADNGNQYVYEFPPGHSQPSLTLEFQAPGPPATVAGLAVDNANNLYVDWGVDESCCDFGLEVFAPGARHGHHIRFGRSEYGGDVITTPDGDISVGVGGGFSGIEIGRLPHPGEHGPRRLDLPHSAFSVDPMSNLLYDVSSEGALNIYRFGTGQQVGAARGFSGAHAVAIEQPPLPR
jgi:hypothetical protein